MIAQRFIGENGFFIPSHHASIMKDMDYESWYERISEPFRGDNAMRLVNVADKAMVIVVAAVYIAVLAWLFFTGDRRLPRAVLVPMFTFALVSVIRERIDAPRPYELYAIDPIIFKDTRGKSFPSRHLASAVIIACALAWLNPVLGVLGFICSIIVAFTRIVGGVHFPRDIAASIGIALACGLVGFVIIP